MHHPDPAAVVRHQRQALREGGVYVAMEWDYLTTRSDPSSPLLERTIKTMVAGCADRRRRGRVRGEVDLGTLRQRMVAELEAIGGTFVMPTLVGAWGRQPTANT